MQIDGNSILALKWAQFPNYFESAMGRVALDWWLGGLLKQIVNPVKYLDGLLCRLLRNNTIGIVTVQIHIGQIAVSHRTRTISIATRVRQFVVLQL